MTMYAYNKTTGALPIPAVSPVVTLPVSTAAPFAGAKGQRFDITDELEGLTPTQYANIQLLVAAGSLELQWTDYQEYSTHSLVVGNVQTSSAAQAHLRLYVNGGTGDDGNDGLSPSTALATFARATDVALFYGKTVLIELDSDGTGRAYSIFQVPAAQSPTNGANAAKAGGQKNAGQASSQPIVYSKAQEILVPEQVDAVGGLNFALQGTFPTSALTADPGAGGTTISLTSAVAFPNVGMIRIENEYIRYTGKSGNDLTGCVRAFANSTAAAHAIGTVALLRLDGYFVQVTECATSTTLSGAVDADDTTITVASTAAFPTPSAATPGILVMASGEIIGYSSKNATQFLNCIRGYAQTTPAAHANGATVQGGANMLQRRQIKSNTATHLFFAPVLGGNVVAGSKFKVTRCATSINISGWSPYQNLMIFKDIKLIQDSGTSSAFGSQFRYCFCEVELAGGGFINFASQSGAAYTIQGDQHGALAGGANTPIGAYESNGGLRFERISGAITFRLAQKALLGNGFYAFINVGVNIFPDSTVVTNFAVIQRLLGGTCLVQEGSQLMITGGDVQAARPSFENTNIVSELGSVVRLSTMDLVNTPANLSSVTGRRGSLVQMNAVGGLGAARYGLEMLDGPGHIVDTAVSSTLTADPGAGGTTISLTSAAAFATPAAGSFAVAQIENEIIFYTGKSGNDLTGCIRGMQGTNAAAHAIGATIDQGTCVKGTLGRMKAGARPVRTWSDFFATSPASGLPSKNELDVPGFLARPFKLTFTGLVAADLFDITTIGASASPAGATADVASIWEGAPPAIANASTLRVTAGAAAFVGNYALTDAAGTRLSPATDTVVGVAQLSDDGKTITFPVGAAVTAFVIEYTPIAPLATGARIWQAA